MNMDINDIMPPDWQLYNYTLESFDKRLLAAYAKAKEKFPDIWVNLKDGKRVNNWCGLRSPSCAVGARNSAHKAGKALDMHSAKLGELRAWCESAEGLAAGITRVEAASATPTWVHIDIMPPNESKWSDRTKPYVFSP